jgi:hypothetical protein
MALVDGFVFTDIFGADRLVAGCSLVVGCSLEVDLLKHL